MKAFFPVDNSYFSVKFIDGKEEIDLSKNVISLSLTEEIQKMTTGQLSIIDPYHVYSRYLKNGKIFTLEFGYTKKGINYQTAIEKNSSELIGDKIRRGLRCFIQSPGGSCSQAGEVVYNCNFYSEEFKSNIRDTVWYKNQLKKTVIESVLTKLGVDIQNQYIDFIQQNDFVKTDNAVLQNETYFKFLNRLAYEWRCTFIISRNQRSELVGLFVSNSKINSEIANTFKKISCGGTTGSTKLFEFGVNSMYPNVISYSWKHNIGDSGYGDGNKIEVIDGKTVVTNYTVENAVVKISKLNESRLKEYITKNKSQKNLLEDILKSSSLSSKIGDATVGYFFDTVDQTSAPQGLGYSADVQLIGDVLIMPLVEVKFGNGFPDFFKNIEDVNNLNLFFVKKVTHTIDINGFKSNVEVADVVTTFGGFVR